MGKNENPKQVENVETTAVGQEAAVESTVPGKKKVKVKQVFRDKFNKAVRYEVGQVLDFEEERAADLVNRKLAEYVVPMPTE